MIFERLGGAPPLDNASSFALTISTAMISRRGTCLEPR
jgi:hypothetical protein